MHPVSGADVWQGLSDQFRCPAIARRRRKTRIPFHGDGDLGRPPEKPAPTVQHHRTVPEAFDGLPLEPDDDGIHFALTLGDLAMSRFKLIPPKGDKRDVMRLAPELCPPSWMRISPQATDV